MVHVVLSSAASIHLYCASENVENETPSTTEASLSLLYATCAENERAADEPPISAVKALQDVDVDAEAVIGDCLTATAEQDADTATLAEALQLYVLWFSP